MAEEDDLPAQIRLKRKECLGLITELSNLCEGDLGWGDQDEHTEQLQEKYDKLTIVLEELDGLFTLSTLGSAHSFWKT